MYFESCPIIFKQNCVLKIASQLLIGIWFTGSMTDQKLLNGRNIAFRHVKGENFKMPSLLQCLSTQIDRI